MDQAQERLAALSRTQQALMDKIRALEEAEAFEDEAEPRVEEVETAPAEDEEQALLAMLMQKQAELQKMRAAIDELKQMDASVTDQATRLRPEAPSFEPRAPAPSSSLRPDAPAFAPPPAQSMPTGGGEPSEADLLAALMAKRDELMRMQAAIKQLESMEPDQAEEEAEEVEEEDLDYEDEDFEQDDEDEPGTQEEWMQKLMQQQRELMQLRSAIEMAKRGAAFPPVAEEEEEDEPEAEAEEDDPGMQAVLANLLAKKQELSELLALKANLEKQLLAREDEDDEDDEDDEASMARIPNAMPRSRPLSAPPSDHPRARGPGYGSAPATPQRDEEPPARIPPNTVPATRPLSAPPSDHPRGSQAAEQEEDTSKELLAVLDQRRRAQQAVSEQERKIAELSALQERLRTRLADLEGQDEEEDEEDGEEDEDEDEEYEEEDDEEEEEEPSEGITGEQLLQILQMKTRECQQLAAAVEQARESGMDERDPRLAQAEATLAYRYDEVKELAAIAARHGLSASIADDAYEEEEARPLSSGQLQYEDDGYYEQQQALRKRWGNAQGPPSSAVNPSAAMQAMEDVERLEEELQACTDELRAVDSQTSREVARHPAFQSMRQSVVDRLLSLQAQLDEAKAHYEHEMDLYETSRARALQQRPPPGRGDEEEQMAVHEADMVPLLRDALDKLWDRPYEARVFTLQLLQGLADLEDRSLCMMCSCFARYLEKHSEPVD